MGAAISLGSTLCHMFLRRVPQVPHWNTRELQSVTTGMYCTGTGYHGPERCEVLEFEGIWNAAGIAVDCVPCAGVAS